jgi:hypothetical protein
MGGGILDVVDDKPADPERRGYLVDPCDARDRWLSHLRCRCRGVSLRSRRRYLRVVGLAIFSERSAMWTRHELATRDRANPFPHRSYALPPR